MMLYLRDWRVNLYYLEFAERPNRTLNTMPSALINRRLLYYVAFGVLFGLIYQRPRQYLGYLSLKNPHTASVTDEQLLFLTSIFIRMRSHRCGARVVAVLA